MYKQQTGSQTELDLSCACESTSCADVLLLLLLQFLGIDGYAEQYDKSNKVEHSWFPR
jgi:hypothetical protein